MVRASRISVSAVLVISLMSAAAAQAQSGCEIAARIAIPADPEGGPGKHAYRLDDGSVVFLGRLRIDADGAPRAYHPNSARGLDRLSDAGHDGDWWAIATDARDGDGDPDCREDGDPITQGAHDPAPGFYVSMTTMTDPRVEDCRRQSAYVDSTAVPYVALPKAIATYDYRRHAGPLAMVFNTRARKLAGAVFADEAPPSGIGEGSIALARRLGYPVDAREGGSERRENLFVVFTEKGRFPRKGGDVETAADAAFERWGGEARLGACEKVLAALPR
jgi:hypothetical protein